MFICSLNVNSIYLLSFCIKYYILILGCVHQGLYGCSECQSGSCEACIAGWFLLRAEVTFFVNLRPLSVFQIARLRHSYSTIRSVESVPVIITS